jgi:Flp pilus assembly protein TadB
MTESVETSAFKKGPAWLLLGMALVAVVLYTVGIVIGSPLLILIGTVVTTVLYFVVRSQAKRRGPRN